MHNWHIISGIVYHISMYAVVHSFIRLFPAIPMEDLYIISVNMSDISFCQNLCLSSPTSLLQVLFSFSLLALEKQKVLLLVYLFFTHTYPHTVCNNSP